MSIKFLYMKLVGLLMVVVGFTYSLTSFYNFFDVIFGNKIMVESANIYIMSIGLIFPLFIFIYGIFFYFYADIYKDKSSKLVFILSIITFIIGISKLVLYNKIIPSYLMEFTHISFAYCVLILSIMLIYGKLKYKY